MHALTACKRLDLRPGRQVARAARDGGNVVAPAAKSQGFLGGCPPSAVDTVQAIRESVAHSTCAPFADMAAEDTLVINPAWADEPRTTVCPALPVATCTFQQTSTAFVSVLLRLSLFRLTVVAWGTLIQRLSFRNQDTLGT